MTYLEQRRAYIEAGRPLKPKKSYTIPKVSKKKIERMKLQAESGIDNALDSWFEERRKEMTGKCILCGGKTEKGNDETYRRSIHHLLEKRKGMFPSVSTHPLNFIEVCFWGNSCHTQIHNNKITWALLRDSKEWDVIFGKILKVYPYIHPEELKHLPSILKDEIENVVLNQII